MHEPKPKKTTNYPVKPCNLKAGHVKVKCRFVG